MMVFLGGMIGGLVVAMYLPIFKMGEVVGSAEYINANLLEEPYG